MRTLLLPLLFLSVCRGQDNAVGTTEVPAPAEEPFWGRLYLRNGLAPIQYFRDTFGGPIAAREVSLHFPKRDEDRLGCELLPEDERAELLAANRSAVLVVDRGECTFEHKARLAEQMGAAGLVLVSPTDDVTRPVGDSKNDDEVSIASVMIRRSGGDMLRAVAAHTKLYGRLIPMTCQRTPYVCKPQTEAEEEYMASFTARSGSILSAGDESASLGSFLAAAYGSILPTALSFPLAAPLDGSQACTAVNEDGSDKTQFSGKTVLLPGGTAGQCSEFEKVSNAQRRGASVAVLVQRSNATSMAHPSVEVSWHAYNITIPVLAVSSTTGDNLLSFKEAQGDAASVRFAVRNGIADAWQLLQEHSERSAWPKRQKRCTKLLANLLTEIRGLGGDAETEAALKNIFLTVVKGKLDEWEKVASPDEDAPVSHERSDSGTQATITQTVEKTQGRDEL